MRGQLTPTDRRQVTAPSLMATPPPPSTDSAPATQSDAVQDDPTIPLSDTQPEFSLAA